MRCWCFLIIALLFFGCQKSDDLSPSNNNSESTEKVNNDEGNSNSGKLSEPVEVTYYLKSRGTNIVDAKYNVNGEDYTACGNKKLNFTYETEEKFELELAGTIKNRSGNTIEAWISIDGKIVAQDVLKADGKKGIYSQVNISHQIQ